MAKTSTVISVDFSDVKESSGINPRHQPEGDYLLRITDATVGKSKGGDTMVTALCQDVNMRSATYPYYCVLKDNQLWKLRNMFIAAGLPVPKSKGKLDVAKLKGKEIGVTLVDDEYEGKEKSVIDAMFHKDELEGAEVEAEDDDFEDEDLETDEEDEEEEEAPAPKAKAKKKPAPVVEEEDDEDEDDEEDDEEEEEPAPVKKKAPAKAKAKAKAKPAPVEEDEEDEDDDEIDLDDL